MCIIDDSPNNHPELKLFKVALHLTISLYQTSFLTKSALLKYEIRVSYPDKLKTTLKVLSFVQLSVLRALEAGSLRGTPAPLLKEISPSP